ncbi:MAG: hypothetical protein WD771_08330 [Gemmatimonadaceae bacterium]
MLLTSTDLESIHRYCSHHRPLLEQSSQAGCFCCGATFAPTEIKEWIHEGGAAGGENAGETAKCPHCGVDSVLPSAAPITLDSRMLAALQAYWFSGTR